MSPLAVCGSVKDRRGIILAKNEVAKKFGVKTAEAIWQAQKKCPQLVVVAPRHGEYSAFSKRVRSIYEQFTDQVESFGIDECYLDVTNSTYLFGNGYEIACKIKNAVKQKTGLTISVGVSFNKIFAKLGSDFKKPDAITCISKENFKQKIWPLNSNTMLGIGAKTAQKLALYGIHTIGDVANSKQSLLANLFGKTGELIWNYANGLDRSVVAFYNENDRPKSVGNGTTTAVDLKNNVEVFALILSLTQEVSRRLRKHNLCAGGVSVSVRNNKMQTKEFQCQLSYPTQSATIIANRARELFESKYSWQHFVRLVTITAINLFPKDAPIQTNLFDIDAKQAKFEKLDDTVSVLRNKYGKNSIQSASLIKKPKKDS